MCIVRNKTILQVIFLKNVFIMQRFTMSSVVSPNVCAHY